LGGKWPAVFEFDFRGARPRTFVFILRRLWSFFAPIMVNLFYVNSLLRSVKLTRINWLF